MEWVKRDARELGVWSRKMRCEGGEYSGEDDESRGRGKTVQGPGRGGERV